VVTGFGADSYRLGFEALARYLDAVAHPSR